MNIFFISYHFDEKHTGDFDYCQKMVDTLNSVTPNSAFYLTGQELSFKEEYKITLIAELNSSKNEGGKLFDLSIKEFVNSPLRCRLVLEMKKYLLSHKQKGKNLINLQLRPPESGMIFTPQDLRKLQTEGFKICITCHEYKLNYNRRWLQKLCHQYFSIADIILFFNQKDLKNASKHATRAVFIDDYALLNKLSEPINEKNFLHGFSRKSHTTFIHKTESNRINLMTTNQDFKEISCEFLAGEMKYNGGSSMIYNEAGKKCKFSSSVTMEWGMRNKLNIVSQSNKFTVFGFLFNLTPNEETNAIKEITKGKFDFDHPSYDLYKKAALTRVPPTTTKIAIKFPSFQNKPPNIIIFGAIRENKGFEMAIELIKSLQKNTHLNSRLIIVGNPVSLELLAYIINQKFNCEEITKKLLNLILNKDETSEKMKIDVINKIVQKKYNFLEKELKNFITIQLIWKRSSTKKKSRVFQKMHYMNLFLKKKICCNNF